MAENNVKELLTEENEEQNELKIEKNGKTIDVNELIEKGKKGALSTSDLDNMIEELDYDMDRLDKLYETLEDNGILLPGDISNTEISEICDKIAKVLASKK